MCVTPVACRYFLGHAEHGRFGKRVEAFIDGARRALRARRSARVLPYRVAIVVASRRARRRRAAGPRRACRARSSPRSTSRWSASTCASRPARRSRRRPRRSHEMGKTLASELPKGNVELVLTNVGSPKNARSAMTSPNSGPAHGLHPPRARRRRRSARSRSARSPTRSREILNQQLPRRRVPAVARRPRRERLLRTATSRRSSSRSAATTSTSSTRRRAPSPRSRARCPGVRDVCVVAPDRLPRDPRRDRPRGGRPRRRDARAPPRRPRSRRRSATSTRRASGSTRPTVSRTTSSPTTTASVVTDPNALAQIPVRVERRRQAPCPLGAYGKVRRSVGPDRGRAQPAPARRARPDADRGPRHRQRRRRARAKRCRATRARAAIDFDFVGQVELMRTTFSGLGARDRARRHGRLHDHGVAVQVAAPAVRHALHDPGVARRHRARAAWRRGRASRSRRSWAILMVVGIAVSNGILLVDDANRRFDGGRRQASRPSSPRRARASCRSR